MLTLIQTARLNDIDPQAWLADVLARIADHKITDLAALLPWNWAFDRRIRHREGRQASSRGREDGQEAEGCGKREKEEEGRGRI